MDHKCVSLQILPNPKGVFDRTDTVLAAVEVGVAIVHVVSDISCCICRITGCGAVPSYAMLFPLTW